MVLILTQSCFTECFSWVSGLYCVFWFLIPRALSLSTTKDRMKKDPAKEVEQKYKTQQIRYLNVYLAFPFIHKPYIYYRITNALGFLWANYLFSLKVARYSFPGPIPPMFEHKLRSHKQSFEKIATTVVLDKDENLLWSGLQRHRSCHSNEMTLLPILLLAVYLGTRNCSSKIVHGSFFLQ